MIDKFEEPQIALTVGPSDVGQNLAIPTFILVKALCKDSKNVQQESIDLATKLVPLISQECQNHEMIEKIEESKGKPYINVWLKSGYLGQFLSAVKDGSYKNVIPTQDEKVMIEYSQPNTHKTFHVGHMRNASLGMSLVKIFEFNKFKVNAVNYIGDVGTHIAKCLWYYLNYQDQSKGIAENVPEGQSRVEYLGDMYAFANDMLDFSQWTKFVFPGVVTAQIVEIGDHPSNPKLKVLMVTVDGTTKLQVVCGGKGYALNDIVAYVPVGSRKGGRLVAEADFKGVKSFGLIMSEVELNVGKDKDKIYLFPKDTLVGKEIMELGRYQDTKETPVPKDIQAVDNLAVEMKRRNDGVRSVLRSMEEKEEKITKLWELTRQWCLTEFREIYDWTGCRFDHYFHESDVGDESKEIVIDAYNKGLLQKSDGCIGLDLGKLGYSILLTSDGTGLYATKDIALAKKKFEEFNIDKSIYVVDMAQTLHFQQVFKVLEKLGFKQAPKCYHLSYGIVTLPDGKMSSRKGNIITFSMLKNQLLDSIYEEYLNKYRGNWPEEEIKTAAQRIAVAIIKYGMLKMDSTKDIVYIAKEWSAATGNTGPYVMYAYARIRSIIREVPLTEDEKKIKVDPSILVHPTEKKILAILNSFTDHARNAGEQYKPHLICTYVYVLARFFSRMYEEVSVKKAESPELKVARLYFIDAIGDILKQGLDLLGIETIERM